MQHSPSGVWAPLWLVSTHFELLEKLQQQQEQQQRAGGYGPMPWWVRAYPTQQAAGERAYKLPCIRFAAEYSRHVLLVRELRVPARTPLPSCGLHSSPACMSRNCTFTTVRTSVPASLAPQPSGRMVEAGARSTCSAQTSLH